MSYVFPIFGAGVALAGGDKLYGLTGYRRLFNRLGWSRCAVEALGVAEVAGGLLLVPRATRGLGGAVLLAASAVVLANEWRHGDVKLAAPRGLLLAIAAAAMLTPARPLARRAASPG